MLHKTRAIVLHSLRYGDSSLIVHAFTEEWGRQSFLLKGIRKSGRSNRANMYQPLFLLELDIYYRENREMHWIRDAAFIDSPPSFYSDMVKSTQALFISEILMKTLQEQEKNPALFSFIFHSVQYLESLKNGSPSFHLIFLFQLSGYLGFHPGNNFSTARPFFDPVKGSFSAAPVTADSELEREIGEGWSSCFNMDYSNADQQFTNKKSRNIFLDSLLGFYRIHLQSMGELKSLDILRTVFS